MAEASTSATNTSVVLTTESREAQPSPTLHLKLRRPKNDKKVKWTTETVDNEHMNKKKSKCCCIYEKPRMFGESSDEDDDNDGCSHNCRGHKNKCYKANDADGPGPTDEAGPSS